MMVLYVPGLVVRVIYVHGACVPGKDTWTNVRLVDIRTEKRVVLGYKRWKLGWANVRTAVLVAY